MLADIIPKIAAELQGPPADYSERPSSAGPERCIRSLTYHAVGIPRQPFPGRAMLIFDDSSWHEELTKDWIRKSAFTLHSEQMPVTLPGVITWKKGQARWCRECKKNLPAEDLHGHPDGILTDLARVDRLLEHKAINHFGFDRIWKGDWPLDNLTQLAIYMRAVQLLAPELVEGLLLLKNKNTAQYMELLCQYHHVADRLIVVEVNRSGEELRTVRFVMEGVVEQAIAKFAAIEDYRARSVLPVRPFAYGTEFPCGYCGWAAACWGSFEQEFQAMAEGAKLAADVVALCQGIVDKRGQVTDMKAEAKELREKVAALLKAQEQDIVDACGYYFQADSDAKELGGELDALRSGVRTLLWQEGVRQGRAGDYSVTLSLQKRAGYFVEPTQWEQVNIRKVKPEDPKAKKPRKKKEAADGEADPGPGPAGPGDPSS
jgi:hypothetical protein